jgi:type I restriction-modification system DNA methylase subunit
LLNDVSPQESTYYKAILQNLFFATLNQEMDKREFRKDGQHFMAHNLYRYRRLLKNPDEALKLFAFIPFMNGGLFECLDKTLGTREKPDYIRIDGFSDRNDNSLKMPNELFFGPEREVDLSAAYGAARYRKARVCGLIHILDRYKFTVAENTPIEEEVALDPELLGKVFENLLAAYNPETGATARKQTGSFYTPREIVHYMVDESLLASLKTKLEAACPSAENSEERLRHLFAYNDQPHQFTTAEVDALIEAIDHLKILDPACGSGAFPMGILHKLVFVLSKLDPGNQRWKARQLAKVAEISDTTLRERVLDDIEESFGANELDYGRKLYLIENCIYGVDIQPIAVQIAKLRFFISLVVNQKINLQAENVGIRSLPNLETRFVAANTLIGLDRPVQQPIRDPYIEAKEADLRDVRERRFLARTPATKAKYREQDAKLRSEIAELLKSDGWDTATARKLALWDPYDQNKFALFFDLEWMFDLTDEFDVVIGNPPYGRIVSGRDEEIVASRWPEFRATRDAFVAFVLGGLKLNRDHATLSFIIPTAWLGGPSYKMLRAALLRKTIEEIVVLPFDMFAESYVDTLIVRVTNNPPSANHVARAYTYPKRADPNEFRPGPWQMIPIKEWHQIPDNKFVLSESGIAMACTLRENCKRTFASLVEMRRGVLFDQNLLTNRKTISKSHPYFEGDVYRYHLNYIAPHWVEYGPKMKEYPKEFRWFEGKRLLLRRLVNRRQRLMATITEDTFITNKNLYTLLEKPGSEPLKVTLALLNSRLVSRLYIEAVSQATKDDFPQVTITDLLALPVPTNITEDARIRLSKLVDRILDGKKVDADANTAALEKEIDGLVYHLYGLTPDEIRLIEDSAPSSGHHTESASDSSSEK